MRRPSSRSASTIALTSPDRGATFPKKLSGNGAETFRAALAELTASEKIDVQGENVKPPGAAIRLDTDEASTKSQIETAFAEAGLTVPAVKEVLANVKIDSKQIGRAHV